MNNETLSADQWRTLRALIDCLIPADDDWPSGWQAGVGDYLARQFQSDLHDQVERYRAGLDALDVETKASTGKAFADLSLDAQTHLLTKLEQGQTHVVWPIDPKTFPQSFLNMAMTHAAEGFYSDPGNGGNKNDAAWRMVGYEVKG